MVKVINIGVLSFAKFQGFLLLLLGGIAGILYSFGGLIYDLFITGTVNWGTALAFFALLGMPIIFGVFGFFIGILEAILYNMFASQFGGLFLEIVE